MQTVTISKDDWIENFHLEDDDAERLVEVIQSLIPNYHGDDTVVVYVQVETTCLNCDKPTSGAYCSTVCEDMDKHPSPRDDMEKFTEKNHDDRP